MHPAEIQCALKMKGLTVKSLAERIGVSPITVGAVILKRTISDHIMKAVAEAINRPAKKVFPEYYELPPKRKTSKRA